MGNEAADLRKAILVLMGNEAADLQTAAANLQKASVLMGDKAGVLMGDKAADLQKPTNPKDALGIGRAPLQLVPETLAIYASLAFLEGALKYGQFNWRRSGVRASVYIAAMKRHLAKLSDGEWADKKSGVPHLSSILASAGIYADAYENGMLIDDRPPPARTSELIDAMPAQIEHLKNMFKDFSPHQHTCSDGLDTRGTSQS